MNNIRSKAIKLTLTIAALVAGGEGYVLIQEVRETGQRLTEVYKIMNTTVGAVNRTSDSIKLLTNQVERLKSGAVRAEKECSKAAGKGDDLIRQLRELNKKIDEMRRKLRLQREIINERY